MARFVQDATFTQSGRGTGGFNVTWYGADALQEIFADIGSGLEWTDKGDLIPRRTAANRQLREAAKEIAQDILIPQMKRTARSAPVPIARAMAETARAKSDRLIMVQVGGVNPPLSGFRRGIGTKRRKGGAAGRTSGRREATSRTFRTTLAWGSEFGPLGGRAKPSRGSNVPAREVNHYKVARRYPQGYWVLPAVDDVRDRAVDRWEYAVEKLIDRYIRFVPGGTRG
jgi:hypothetical protein